jgi:branched-chain amino acid transport system permease protein
MFPREWSTRLILLLLLYCITLPFWASSSFVVQVNLLLPWILLGLALHVVVGYTGMLHLGIMAFFAIGVFAAAICTTKTYPLQIGFWPAIPLAIAVTACCGVLIGSPTLRLRGDYLALVTLGFGEMVKDTLYNMETITQGNLGIRNLPPVGLPLWWQEALSSVTCIAVNDSTQMFAVNLVMIVAVWWLLANLERSRLGRAWVALREDEIAAQCMGLNTTRLKLAAFALCAGLAGLAGVLYLYSNESSLDPLNYNFNSSILVLAGVILGGIGNRAGAVLGVTLILGFERIVVPWLGDQIKVLDIPALDPRNWNYMIYGVALILMMRFRPLGIFPEKRSEV